MLYKAEEAEGHPLLCQVPSFEKASAAFPVDRGQGRFLRGSEKGRREE